MDPLTNEDVADILALLDSLSYDEFDLETPGFRLSLRRTPGGWTQSTQVLSAPEPLTPVVGDGRGTEDASVDGGGEGGAGVGNEGGAGVRGAGGAAGDGGHEDAELVAVRAPLPGTFYRAPRPGAAPFAEVGSRVGADTVIGIVETMKLMNSVPAGVAGVVAEFCVTNAELVAQGAALLRIRAEE
jgi:acetyl-CoA carboxylase biotin carboxyl carrier protein